tara:strand:+ start:4712 stop:5563 length:852 start_codon:yes stop_codon:yes gene_type:complete
MAEENKTEILEKDNLIDVLEDFNDGNAPARDESEETNKEAQERQEAVKYLIDNKFEDTPEGREKLAKSYTELQSKTDKDKAQFSEKSEHYGRLDKLDGYLKENPGAVKLLQSHISEEKEQLKGPPTKPDGYDILDEAIEGSESALWRDGYNTWLIDQGRVAAQEEVQNYKDDLAKQAVMRQDDEELSGLGLSDADKEEFRSFLTNPGNLTNETLVNIWKFLNSDGGVMPSGKTATRKNLQTSAASVSGNTPSAITPQSEELDSFWDGIMDTTNRVGGTSANRS